MDENKLEELLTLTRDNNKMLKDIWAILNNPNRQTIIITSCAKAITELIA